MILNSTTENIIFDLGGVILNLDTELTNKAFAELGLDGFNSTNPQEKHKNILLDYETGKISSTEFRNTIKTLVSKNISDDEINNAWNAMLLDLSLQRIELLEQLSKRYRIFLLSNTNEIHISKFFNIAEKATGIDKWNSIFEKQYFSHEIKMRKPNQEIFDFVLQENNLNPKQTLFIDDSAGHLKGAKATGINTYWLDVKKESILDLF